MINKGRAALDCWEISAGYSSHSRGPDIDRRQRERKEREQRPKRELIAYVSAEAGDECAETGLGDMGMLASIWWSVCDLVSGGRITIGDVAWESV